MFRANLKIAWRNLLKDKEFTLLNILGLSAGLACTLLIFLWVNDEMSYDKFFANKDRVYKLFEQRNYNGQPAYSEESSGRLSDAVKMSTPGDEYAAAVAPSGWFPQITLSANDKNINANGQYAEKDYFNIFSFPLLDGNWNTVLANNNSIVLSDYQQQYESETRVSVLSRYFAGLAIIISCLGLFGLSAFTAQKRRKEIGVRKVIGASVVSITTMLSKDFLKLVGISLMIAFPVAWWLMSNWLQTFAYRIRITPSIFLITTIIVVAITICTISYQSIKAAIANPVKSLRSE